MERKLASIQIVSDLQPIPNADKIELATCLGWQCIVKKDEFKIGDKGVFFEIDSIVDKTNPVFEFMTPRRFRVKTQKMRGVISQGLLLPLRYFERLKLEKFEVGSDITDLTKTTKYDAELTKEQSFMRVNKNRNRVIEFLLRFSLFRKIYYWLNPHVPQSFPSDYVSKTDQSRIQSEPYKLEKYAQNLCYATEKLDGCIERTARVLTEKGYLPIGDIVNKRSAEYVLSYNEEKQICEFKKILDYHKLPTQNKTIYKIGVGHRGKGNRPKFITCSDNHKFLTDNMSWIRADCLKKGQIIYHHVNKDLNFELKSVAVGCLLGDGFLRNNGDYLTIGFSQSENQKEYLEYKGSVFGDLYYSKGEIKSGYGSKMFCGALRANLAIYNFLMECFPHKKKTVTRELLSYLTPAGLAFWYMDDGNITNRMSPNLSERIQINTQGFSLEENKLLQEILQDKFNINASIGEKSVYKGYVILLDVQNTQRFCSLIAPYVCKSMKYKLPKIYENTPCFYDSIQPLSQEGVAETKVLSITKIDFKQRYLYDLTIEDNPNYFANQILVHNCSSTYVLSKNKSKLPFSPKYDYAVCSRNYRVDKTGGNHWAEMSKKYNLEKTLIDLFKKIQNMGISHNLPDIESLESIAIQGEIIGQGIQGNKYKKVGKELRVFGIILQTKKNRYRLNQIDINKICNIYNLQTVNDVVLLIDCCLPQVDFVGKTVQNWVDKSIIKTQEKTSDVWAEGIVVSILNDKGLVIDSFKVINPQFLLKYEGEEPEI